jgi:uncharacterized protein YmfQ (DUF2313 family)
MLHKDSAKLLFPLELGGIFDDDIALEGAILDEAQSRAEELFNEMFPDGSTTLLAAWERMCGIVPAEGASLQTRRNAVLKQLRYLGGQSRAYFIALAADAGWTITIDELQPFRAGINRCGDTLYVEAIRFVWRVNVFDRATWADEDLETLLNDLKPAHTYVIFNYDAFEEEEANYAFLCMDLDFNTQYALCGSNPLWQYMKWEGGL